MAATSRTSVKKAPRSLRLHGFLRLFVRVRTFAALGALAVIAASDLLSDVGFPYRTLYAIAAGVLVYNAGFALFLARKRPAPPRLAVVEEPDLRLNRVVALAQINLDFAALACLLHFSGGLENPFVLFFVFHVVIAGILLEAPYAAAEAVLAALVILGLGASEKLGLLAHYHAAAVLGPLELASSWPFVLGLSAIMAATIAALSGFTIALMGKRTRQRDQMISLANELQAKNDKLQQLDESRRRLLAVATHDLKSPVGAVTSYLVALRDGYLGPIAPAQVEVIEKSLKRLERLREFINDVLSLQAIRHGEVQKALRPTDVGALLREIAQNYEDAARDREVALSLELDGDLPLVEAAPELAQVFDNLLSNAVKYSRDGGRVAVRAHTAGSHLLVEIADTGIGISEDDLGHLFEDYFRAPAVKATHEGTGLGLAVSQRIVRAHQGEIQATSQVGVGTTFHVGLPIVQPLHSIPPEDRDSGKLVEEVMQALRK